jgi:HrpA-like RNA helicase
MGLRPRVELPVDGVLPELLALLRSGSSVVLEAPPGAGKTTRVPPALLEVVRAAGGGGDGRRGGRAGRVPGPV